MLYQKLKQDITIQLGKVYTVDNVYNLFKRRLNDYWLIKKLNSIKFIIIKANLILVLV